MAPDRGCAVMGQAGRAPQLLQTIAECGRSTAGASGCKLAGGGSDVVSVPGIRKTTSPLGPALNLPHRNVLLHSGNGSHVHGGTVSGATLADLDAKLANLP